MNICKDCGLEAKSETWKFCHYCTGDFLQEELEDTPKVNVQQIEKYLEGIEHYNKLIRRRLKMLYPSGYSRKLTKKELQEKTPQ